MSLRAWLSRLLRRGGEQRRRRTSYARTRMGMTTCVWNFISRPCVTLRFDLRSVADTLFPDAVAADDHFICPLSADEIEAARLRDIASLKELARRAEPKLRLVVNR